MRITTIIIALVASAAVAAPAFAAEPSVSADATAQPSPERPDETDTGFAPELRLLVAGSSFRARDASVDWISESRNMERVEAGIGALVAPGLSVFAEFSHRNTENWILGSFENDFQIRTIGARLRYAFELPIPIVRPYVSAGAGVVLARNDFYGPSETLESTAIGWGGDVAAGIEAQTRGRFSVGAYNDYGYAYRSDLTFDDAAPATDDGPNGEVDLGTVSLHGFQWRLGVFLSARF